MFLLVRLCPGSVWPNECCGLHPGKIWGVRWLVQGPGVMHVRILIWPGFPEPSEAAVCCTALLKEGKQEGAGILDPESGSVLHRPSIPGMQFLRWPAEGTTHLVSPAPCLKPCWMSKCLQPTLWDLNVSLAGNPRGALRGCANSLTMSACVCALGFARVAHNALFFLDNGALWTRTPCHAKGVTCVCHKWALVWLIAMRLSPQQPFSTRLHLFTEAVVGSAFFPRCKDAAVQNLLLEGKWLVCLVVGKFLYVEQEV